ncbi:trypsin-like peptidase domain-containing protein [Anaerococcus vaginalis]|uniref:trypsin-like peptidase domain-containing protein n=1 Tax=Anaerococcus vaginalis TaxID=33037 RepID=UPI002913EE91|nr:trypsin-like peptidase domain-containing protein [Anaerococcus vaginalis]MDU5251782.1 serine protease [Anaerococcus vaginalis]MDU6781150.1 serine protease [Anaerococcus vaginalis]
MIPVNISEQLMFNTVRLETKDGSSGTGFFFDFIFDDIRVPILVTNKHVLNYNKSENITFYLHLREGSVNETIESHPITLTSDWIFHSNQDLCFTFINPVFKEVKSRTGKDVYYVPAEESIIPDEETLNNLSALEEIVMIGYPIGLWDKINNYPIFRKGYTSSHPSYDFNKKGIALADIAAFPGSSGSPIYIVNEGSYKDKSGGIILGQNRLIFLGVLFAGPTINTNGEIVAIDIPTQQKIISKTSIMTNLGYYIKSNELLEFKNLIRNKLININ